MISCSWSGYLFVFFLLLEFNGCFGCLPEERNALLRYKATTDPNSDALITWVDDETSDCCAWEQLKCNTATGRVIELYVNLTFNVEGDSMLNASLFLPFKQLQVLDLARNFIEGWYKNEGFERLAELKNLKVLNLQNSRFDNRVLPPLSAITSLTTLDLYSNSLGFGPSPELYGALGKLSKLEVLNLNGNSLNNSILPFLAPLTSLKTLNLGQNSLEGSLSEYSRVFTNMRNLEMLDLSTNALNDFLPFNDLRNMSKLRALNLRQNNMSRRVPPSIFSISSLEALSLEQTNVKDTLSGFCKLKNLQELDLRENKMEGVLPPCLNNMTLLRRIEFSSNQLRGTISPSLISNLKSLEYISLKQNPFDGTFSFTSSIDYKFQLRFLDLSNCNLNTSTTNLLKFLHNQYDLRHVDISDNNFQGEFPNWLLENNTRLQNLFLRNNLLDGQVRFPHRFGSVLRSMDLSNNHFQGQIQANLGDALPELRYLNMSKNKLEGTIPSSLGNIKGLRDLDLSKNNFSGELPERLALGCEMLSVLDLSHNRLQSQIPLPFFKIPSMSVLSLNDNEFTGNIPYGEVPFSSMDISNNHISGRIPTWITNSRSLNQLALGGNSFDGPIPTELCSLYSLYYLDLSHNHLSGVVPSCLTSLDSLRYLHLQGNELTGPIPKPISPPSFLSVLLTLDLSSNNLTGSIPSGFGSVSSLQVLLLNGNRLSGLVPRRLCQLNKIAIMDLSRNMFSGSIPSCFSNITFGKERAYQWTIGTDYLYRLPTYNYVGILEYVYSGTIEFYHIYTKYEEVQFMSKSYKGDILASMSGLDMSRNYFKGSIPTEIGNLTAIKALDFSRNHLTGQIPNSMSYMAQVQIMDLSHNKLNGRIPSRLNRIQTLTVFSVAYNNLTGRIPTDTRFGESSYLGNPFLCGPPLRKSCN